MSSDLTSHHWQILRLGNIAAACPPPSVYGGARAGRPSECRDRVRHAAAAPSCWRGTAGNRYDTPAARHKQNGIGWAAVHSNSAAREWHQTRIMPHAASELPAHGAGVTPMAARRWKTRGSSHCQGAALLAATADVTGWTRRPARRRARKPPCWRQTAWRRCGSCCRTPATRPSTAGGSMPCSGQSTGYRSGSPHRTGCTCRAPVPLSRIMVRIRHMVCSAASTNNSRSKVDDLLYAVSLGSIARAVNGYTTS